MRETPNENSPSLEVTSKAATTDDEMKAGMKSLAEKLSTALVNVSAKEDLVKQHAKVAEEAVAGWEKAENEVAALKQQLEVVVQQNLDLEVKKSQLDGALMECVRQLRQARDEQEKRISDAMSEKNRDWESSKAELQKRILDLQADSEAPRVEYSASADHNTLLIVEALEKENSFLKQELVSRGKELEVLAIERDLSTQAAETASRLQLESIKKIAKLEADCRRLQSIARKSSPPSIQKSVSASFSHTEYLTGSHSDSEERLNRVDIDSSITSNTEVNGSGPGWSDSWTSISDLDQFKKPSTKNLAACSFEIDMMDDFLEMERLAALPKSNTPFAAQESASGEPISLENQSKAELDTMIQRVIDLENMLEKLEAEKLELQNALDESLNSLKKAQNNMAKAEIRLEELQKELTAANEMKESLEFQLVNMEVESRTMSANVDSLKAEIETERRLSAELTIKCQELEIELVRRIQEIEREQNTKSNCELKIKQEDLAVAADKLAECQKTIAALGRQLESLATLEDFLIDTSNIPGFTRDSLGSATGGEIWRLHSSDTFIPNSDMENDIHLANGNEDSSRSSSLSPSSTNHGIIAKSRNSLGKFFC